MKNRRYLWIAIAIAIGIVAADQVTKLIAVRCLQPVESVTVIDHVLRFTYVENPGAVGGVFAGAPWVFNTITVLAVVALSIALVMGKFKKSKLLSVAVPMIIGGGIGNLIDRLFRVNETGIHYVVDFIDVICVPFWSLVFNVADMFVVIGCLLFIVYCLLEIAKEARLKKEKSKDGSDHDKE